MTRVVIDHNGPKHQPLEGNARKTDDYWDVPADQVAEVVKIAKDRMKACAGCGCALKVDGEVIFVAMAESSLQRFVAMLTKEIIDSRKQAQEFDETFIPAAASEKERTQWKNAAASYRRHADELEKILRNVKIDAA